MAHFQQIDFCLSVKRKFPHYFKHSLVLDVGSLDVNGNNKYLFTDCEYIGLDIKKGKNVDVVSPVHLHKTSLKFNVVICTEMLEHDRHQLESLQTMVILLRSEGLLLITAASIQRREHGTRQMSPGSSPFTNEFYKGITKEILDEGLKFDNNFSKYFCIITKNRKDIYFWGIKR